ncbi:MAG: four helix bundle protein [Aggregatilineales bacterium]
MHNYRKLQVWHKAHTLTLDIYKFSGNYPQAEQYSLTSQTRRAASSIPANIAEGCGRNSDIDLIRFLHIAMGSANELDYHLLLAHDLNYLTTENHSILETQTKEVQRMLVGFINKLRLQE